MTRLLKRVPLDFDWPLRERWKGYVNPHEGRDCESCKGLGASPEARTFADQWYGTAPFDPVAYGSEPLRPDHPAILERARRNVRSFPGFAKLSQLASIGTIGEQVCSDAQQIYVQKEADRLHKLWRVQWQHQLIQADVDALVEEDRLWDFTRRPLTEEQRQNCFENGWTREPNGHRPTAAEVNAWSFDGIGHDAINQWACVRARCAREGVPFRCPDCQGKGIVYETPELQRLHDAWTRQDPPQGEGFQLWNDDEPRSPVFGTIEALCDWCEIHATTFADHRTTAAEWRKMLEAGLVAHVEQRGDKTLLFL